MNMTVDIVIPVYKPDKQFGELINRLQCQTVKFGRIFLMHTGDGVDLSPFVSCFHNIVEIPVRYEEFDHGRTRDIAFNKSDADIVICMTQDALPKNRKLVEELLRPLSRGDVALSYARQIPREDSRITEKYIRTYNYPEESGIKSQEDLEKLGIKTYFCSNVCAAYKREVYLHLGGFEQNIPLNEDMLYAAKCLKNGWKIAYAAEAKVIHSHNYTYIQQLRRNFDIAVSQAQHPDIFCGISSEKEGVCLVKKVIVFLMRKRKIYYIPYFVGECAAKYLGFYLGKKYDRLPQWLVRKCSLNVRFWETPQ